MSTTAPSFKDFDEFYAYYLTEHSNRTNRRIHFAGSTIGLIMAVTGVVTLQLWLIPAAFIVGYGFAWFGHFFIEKNKPATFTYPWQSYKGDWRMWWEMLTGKIPF
ncbi:DUF962 domain-containing protein [Algiphilus sp.]|uniref:DUF962 domain-containing protein n=1 Tax=Algiphilus sp. TaxID=1872431 RepID=UPI001CA7A4CE|nr:DUF962 domain-containing protein [Algiphilus sp.]MBY8964987.1 DUF962 domain-containing protein [Algiphilus acroporae]MCI5063144.1 DUF962 domain-containing protein [Algiphilus sp.]MCI5102922.1 DUF962 domain-containing protein [Algiphilus sp.]MCR9090261.1 DUF962 domain-containing protein [Pseudomonadota bacterium]